MTTQEMLDEALAAQHKLLLTGGVVRVSDGNTTVEYSSASAARLDAYIARLRRALGTCSRRTRLTYVVPR